MLEHTGFVSVNAFAFEAEGKGCEPLVGERRNVLMRTVSKIANHEDSMKSKAIGYWVCTIVIALLLLSGGIMQVVRSPAAIAGITHLGYPVHFAVLLGVWKIVGAIVILPPGFALVKEWAYAGIFIDLTAAEEARIGALVKKAVS